MKRRWLLPWVVLSVSSPFLLAATNQEELVTELSAALKAKDREAFEQCVNFQGVEPEARQAFAQIEEQILAWPTHYTAVHERLDHAVPYATKDGQRYTLNGRWDCEVYIFVSKPPSKGFVVPAGMVNGQCVLLLAVPTTR